ncbi:hypothetical protein [Sphingorhabdus sp.]|jgi:hypothetical protein|uniref:hypothetical protein n=1 Tax=Sphingorhabdus sp. TaxID=1902408 RepID=UPI0037CB7CD6
MADSDFIDLVNGALLAADEAPIGWFDLSNYFRTSNSEFPVNTINDVRARLAQLGYGRTFTDPEPPYGRHFQINQNGREHAAELRRASAEPVPEPEIVYHPPVDSHDWTGIATKIDAAKLALVQNQVTALLLTIDQSPCDDRTKKNARKHAEAIVALLEAPDPPWKVIVELLNNPIFTAFLNTAAVLSLIFGS